MLRGYTIGETIQPEANSKKEVLHNTPFVERERKKASKKYYIECTLPVYLINRAIFYGRFHSLS